MLWRKTDRQTETHLAIEEERQTDRDTPSYRGRLTETHLAIEEERQRHTLLLMKKDRDTPCY